MVKPVFTVNSFEHPEGEEKRIVATLKSFGGRNSLNVDTYFGIQRIKDTNYAEITWESLGGAFKDRAWNISILIDRDIKAPCAAKMYVVGKDGETHAYLLPKSYIEKYLPQRLGNDYVPTVANLYPEFWISIGGYQVTNHEDTPVVYTTVPSRMQWGLGSIAYQFFKDEVSELLANPHPDLINTNHDNFRDWLNYDGDVQLNQVDE